MNALQKHLKRISRLGVKKQKEKYGKKYGEEMKRRSRMRKLYKKHD